MANHIEPINVRIRVRAGGQRSFHAVVTFATIEAPPNSPAQPVENLRSVVALSELQALLKQAVRLEGALIGISVSVRDEFDMINIEDGAIE